MLTFPKLTAPVVTLARGYERTGHEELQNVKEELMQRSGARVLRIT
jgi:hypothetical protein